MRAIYIIPIVISLALFIGSSWLAKQIIEEGRKPNHLFGRPSIIYFLVNTAADKTEAEGRIRLLLRILFMTVGVVLFNYAIFRIFR